MSRKRTTALKAGHLEKVYRTRVGRKSYLKKWLSLRKKVKFWKITDIQRYKTSL